MNRDERSTQTAQPADAVPVTPSAERELAARVRQGDQDAGRRFFRDYYPGVYRYLLYLTRRPETAEDLAQETFLRACRRLDQYDDRAPLKAWLHTIAHREFLRFLRSRREQVSLEEVAEAAHPADAAEAVEWRELIHGLPVAEAEAAVLHYLQGYDCSEIARIVGVPVSTVKYRLSAARAHLERELGEGDLLYLNAPEGGSGGWAWLPLERLYALETRLERGEGNREGEPMERREFLRQAASGAAGVMVSGMVEEKDVVDARLTRKVTLAIKGMALSDVCARLQEETKVFLTAGASVADEKVTLFCEKLPLRDVMRQLSRPFGYTWHRSSRDGAYRYELAQDLRSQLLEEELRSRDRNEALLALDRQMERYRPYLDLSPDEARAKLSSASPEECRLLEHLSAEPWGAIQMYFRLSPREHAALRSGQTLVFSAAPLAAGEHSLWPGENAARKPAEHPLPPDLVRGVLASCRGRRITSRDGQLAFSEEGEEGLPPADVPEAKAYIELRISQQEPGRFTFDGGAGVGVGNRGSGCVIGHLAVGVSPTVEQPRNSAVNARLAGDRQLRRLVTVSPEASCVAAAAASGEQRAASEPKVTTADVLEALHQATGRPIVADFYTRLYTPAAVTVKDAPLFDTLNRLSDTMRLRWQIDRETGWIQLRSASYYDDRLKEVPNRLLFRWSAAREKQGSLSLDDLMEIAALSDAQLDGEEMAAGVKACFGLAEWGAARNINLRPHLRALVALTPAERQIAARPEGLAFGQLSPLQQQQFLAHLPDVGLDWEAFVAQLPAVTLTIDYTLPGGFEWYAPGDRIGPGGPPLRPARARERTREETLAAARRFDPGAAEEQVAPTRLNIDFVYTRPEKDELLVHWFYCNGHWNQRLDADRREVQPPSRNLQGDAG